MSDITDEVNFYKKNIFNLNEHYRTKKVSEYMKDEDIIEHRYANAPEAYYCLNSCNNFTKLIRENESNELIIGEGLIKTYPANKMLKHIKKFLVANLDKKLYDLTIAQTELIKDDHRNVRIVDMKDKQYADIHEPLNKMSFMFPFFKDDDLKKFIAMLADSAYVCGYNYANENTFSVAVQPFDDRKIFIVAVLFEAKYHEEEFVFAKSLYHVTTIDMLSKIKSQGLVPKSKSSRFDYPERIYLFNNASQDMMFNYIETKLVNTSEQTAVVVKIDSNKLQNCTAYKNGKMKFYIDHMFDSTDCSVNALFTYNNVNANLLEDDILIVYVRDGHIERVKSGKISEIC